MKKHRAQSTEHRVKKKLSPEPRALSPVPNLLLIAGTGTNSGKTTLACRIIEQFKDQHVTAIKITPHFHETTPGLVLLHEEKGYIIYEETNRSSTKDSSRMLQAGAEKVYFAKVWDDQLLTVFNEIMNLIAIKTPVICESPALRNFIEPGLFIIMSSDEIVKRADINYLRELPHVELRLEDLKDINALPFGFEDGRWISIIR